jgi:phospholipid/cholesterol/gamma-HCH transport system ATP-binding protein
MIHVEDIHKSFGKHTVLRGVSFDVREKETHVLLGKSGSGKSILLKMLIGLIKPDSGIIRIDQHDIATMSYSQLRSERRKFGMLFQEAALFDSLTVKENIALALRRQGMVRENEIDKQVRQALDLVDLGDVENELPAVLSGGMKKRVGLARAIAPNPQYILYDEPTTGLDPETADEINLLLTNLRSRLGITSVVVTHDIHSAVLVGDRFSILHDGMILITGTLEDLQNSNNEEAKKHVKELLSASRTNKL